jgi:hypothetical protein
MKSKHEERGGGQDQLHMRILMYQQLTSLTVLVVRTRFKQMVRPWDAKANDRSRQGLPEEAMQKANVVEDSWRADKIIVYRVGFRYERNDAKATMPSLWHRMATARRHGIYGPGWNGQGLACKEADKRRLWIGA